MPIYVDPNVAGGGSGTFGDPFKSWSSVNWSADNLFLQKEGTTFGGRVTCGASGTPGNPKIMGTYVAATGAEKLTRVDQARIAPTTDLDAVFSDGRNYVTCRNMTLVCGGGFPNAGFRANNGSFITVESCDISVRAGGGSGSYGIRLDNATGSGASRSDWTIKNNRVTATGGNAGILCIWSANTGENLSGLIVENNSITDIPYVAGSVADGIRIQGRATVIYLDRAGLCLAGLRLNRNQVFRVAGYGMYVQDIIAGAFQNEINGNKIIGVGDGSLDVHCLGMQGVQDLNCFDNVIGDSRAFSGGSTGTGVGIFIDTPTLDSRDGCDRIKVRRNKIFRTGQGAGVGVEVGGAGIFVLAGREIEVQSNAVEDCTNGIVVQGGAPAAHASQNVNVENNTVLRCSRNGIMTIEASDLVSVQNNVVTNASSGIYLQTLISAVTNYTETNNNVFQCALPFSDGNIPGGTTETARTPGGTNTTTDPRLSTDGRPQSGSLLLNTGADLGIIRDRDMVQARKHIGAYAAAALRDR